MKVFVAAEATGGKDDFSWTVPGELVHFPQTTCDCPDCGCERAMAGFVSHKATTCFVVRDLDIDSPTYTQTLFDSLSDGGWVTEDSADDRAWVDRWAAEHLDIAADLPVETPLRIRLDRISVRT